MRAILTLLCGGLVGLAIGLSYMWGLNSKRHTCSAPCTVSFSQHMEEDTFGYDYHDEVVDVFWSAPDETED